MKNLLKLIFLFLLTAPLFVLSTLLPSLTESYKTSATSEFKGMHSVIRNYEEIANQTMQGDVYDLAEDLLNSEDEKMILLGGAMKSSYDRYLVLQSSVVAIKNASTEYEKIVTFLFHYDAKVRSTVIQDRYNEFVSRASNIGYGAATLGEIEIKFTYFAYHVISFIVCLLLSYFIVNIFSLLFFWKRSPTMPKPITAGDLTATGFFRWCFFVFHFFAK